MIHYDKQLHLLYCFTICILFSIVHPWVGIVCAMGAGVWKEWKDSRQPGNAWSWADIAFDIAGTGLGASAVKLLVWRGV